MCLFSIRSDAHKSQVTQTCRDNFIFFRISTRQRLNDINLDLYRGTMQSNSLTLSSLIQWTLNRTDSICTYIFDSMLRFLNFWRYLRKPGSTEIGTIIASNKSEFSSRCNKLEKNCSTKLDRSRWDAIDAKHSHRLTQPLDVFRWCIQFSVLFVIPLHPCPAAFHFVVSFWFRSLSLCWMQVDVRHACTMMGIERTNGINGK